MGGATDHARLGGQALKNTGARAVVDLVSDGAVDLEQLVDAGAAAEAGAAAGVATVALPHRVGETG